MEIWIVSLIVALIVTGAIAFSAWIGYVIGYDNGLYEGYDKGAKVKND